MEQTNSRWLYIFVIISLAGILFFPPRVHADSNWLTYFRNDSLLNTYKRCYAVLDDTLWVGTYGDGLKVTTGSKIVTYNNKNTRTSPSANDGLISDSVTCLTIDENKGRVWIGTNDGLSSCDFEGKEWENYTTSNGLPNNSIKDVAVDKSGNLWIGTSSGVAMFDGEKWYSDFDLKSANTSVHSIKVQGDSVWVGTICGSVSRYKDGEWQSFNSF